MLHQKPVSAENSPELEAAKIKHEAALDSFKSLVKEHGISWTSKTPAEAYAALRECNTVLTEHDRKDAIASMR